MTIEGGGALRATLDALETRGRVHLAAIARREAAGAAASAGAVAAIVVPLIGLIVAFLQPVPVALLLALSAIAPLIVAATVFVAPRRSAVDRAAALAVFDRGDDAKDRVALSDEFLADPAAGGFHAAAVAEAAPWVARAVDMPLDPPRPGAAIRDALRRRARALAGAGLLLIGALLLGRPVVMAPRSPTADAPDAGRAIGHAAAPGSTDRAPTEPTLAQVLVAALGARLAPVDDAQGPSGAGGADRALSAAARPGGETGTGVGTGDVVAGTNRTAAAAVGGGQGGAGSGGGDGGGAGGSGTAGRDSGGGTPGGDSGGTGAQVGAPPDATPPRGDAARSPATSRPGDPRSAGQRTQDRRAATATEAGQASPNAPGSANPADTRRGTPPQGDQASRPAPSQSRQGDSGERQDQAQGNTPGQGNSTPGSAQDALKRSRGVSSLLLAVPTLDRLVGTPDGGISRSTLRQVPPRARDAAGAVAGARGVQRGDAGIVARRPASPHEARLVADYFRRDGAGRGTR